MLVSSDLLGFPREVADPIAARVQKQFGLPRERLLLNSSHTHSAPVIGQMLLPAYPFGDPELAVIRRYTEWLEGSSGGDGRALLARFDSRRN